MNILFFKGILAGLLLGFPAGPIGAIAIRTMLAKGSRHSIFMGLGCGLVDIIYCIMIGLGTKYASIFFASFEFWINAFGGIVLVAIGIRIFFTKPLTNTNDVPSVKGYFGSLALSFILALMSPATFLSFTAVFTGLDLGFNTLKSLAALNTTFGVVIGGAVWWVILGFSIKYFKTRINSSPLKYANKIFGISIICLALFINL